MMADSIKDNAMGIVVDDGSQRVSITNKYGDEIGVFYFRPTDLGIVERYNAMVSKFDRIMEPLEGVSVGADGEANTDDAAQTKALNEAKERLYEALNIVLGGDVAGAFFGKMHPFSPVDGAFYCEKALESLGKYISAQFEAETAKFNKRVEKYTKKYKK